MTSMSWMSGKENIKVENRLLFEKDVIKAVDRHTKDALNNLKIENEPMQKQRRVLLFENENLDLEQRGNRYYLSLYNKEGKFQREVTIDVKDDYKVGLCNSK